MGPNIIASIVVMLVTMFVPYSILNEEAVTVGLVMNKIFNAGFGFIMLTILGMLITFIAQIKSIMNNYIKENLNLLNRMHEGIIVLAEEDRHVEFASGPAIELLKSD